jgi:hypothetical protein
MRRQCKLSLPNKAAAIVALIGIGCIAASPARAVPFDYNFVGASATLTDNVTYTITGTFTADADTSDLTNANVVLSGAGIAAGTYADARGMPTSGRIVIDDDDTGGAIEISFDNSLDTSPVGLTGVTYLTTGAITLSVTGSIVGSAEQPPPLPEAPSIAVLSVGLLGLGWTLRRKRSAR